MSSLPEARKYYTYADYETWDDDFRCELIDGVVYAMGAPSVDHQAISMELSYQLHSFLRGKQCRVFHAPFDVRLNHDTRDDIVVQPDLLVICNPKKIENGKHCLGAPDFVIEILSPSTSRKDQIVKSKRYFDFDVKEYWIINPTDRSVIVLKQSESCFTYIPYTCKEEIPLSVLEGCTIDLKTVFPPLPEGVELGDEL